MTVQMKKTAPLVLVSNVRMEISSQYPGSVMEESLTAMTVQMKQTAHVLVSRVTMDCALMMHLGSAMVASLTVMMVQMRQTAEHLPAGQENINAGQDSASIHSPGAMGRMTALIIQMKAFALLIHHVVLMVSSVQMEHALMHLGSVMAQMTVVIIMMRSTANCDWAANVDCGTRPKV